MNCEYLAEIRKSLNLEKLSKFAESSIFSRKSFHILKGIFCKIKTRKYDGCGQPSCYFADILQNKKAKSFSQMCAFLLPDVCQ